MTPLTNEENKSYRYICKKEFCADDDDKEYHKVRERDRCHYTSKYRGAAAHSNCNLRYKTPKEILVVSHDGFDMAIIL